MNLSDIPISELRVGQVVRHVPYLELGETIYAVVVQISMEAIGHKRAQEKHKTSDYADQRYSTVCLYYEKSGKIRSYFKMAWTQFEVLDAVIHNWDSLNVDEIDWDLYKNAKLLRR